MALLLSIVPMPSVLDYHRPDWLALVIMYWVIALPHRVNVGNGLGGRVVA